MGEQADQFLKIITTFSSIAISLTAILACLSAFFKPIRNFFVWVHKKINGNRDKNAEMINKIDEIKTCLSSEVENVRIDLSQRIQEVSDANDKNEQKRLIYEMKRIRWEILDFANSCKNGRKHSVDEYRHIIEIHDDYINMLKLTKEKNGFLDAEFKYILEVYNEASKTGNFI